MDLESMERSSRIGGECKPLKLCPWRREEEEDEQGSERTRARAAEVDKNVLDVGGSWEKGMNRPRRPARGDDPSDTRSRHGRWRDGALPLATTFPSTPARRGWLARGPARRENREDSSDGQRMGWRSFGRAPPSIPCPVLHRVR